MRREGFLEIDPFGAAEARPCAAEAPGVPRVAGQADADAGVRPDAHAHAQSPPAALPGACLGLLQGFDAQGRALVRDAADLQAGAVPARTTVALHADMVGDTVVMVFEAGDRLRPIVLGVVRRTACEPLETVHRPVSALVDDERVVIRAGREVVLQCGEASITLTRTGRVVIKGAQILSHAKGYNRIKGGAIDIN